jgi:hypothetical protein
MTLIQQFFNAAVSILWNIQYGNWADKLLQQLVVALMLICERSGTTRKVTSFCLQFI